MLRNSIFSVVSPVKILPVKTISISRLGASVQSIFLQVQTDWLHSIPFVLSYANALLKNLVGTRAKDVPESGIRKTSLD